MKYTELQKHNFLNWYINATPEDIALAKETNEELYEDIRTEFAEEVIRIDRFKYGQSLGNHALVGAKLKKGELVLGLNFRSL